MERENPDTNGDGILEGDEVDLENPFEALTGDETIEQDDTEADDADAPFGLGSDDAPGA